MLTTTFGFDTAFAHSHRAFSSSALASRAQKGVTAAKYIDLCHGERHWNAEGEQNEKFTEQKQEQVTTWPKKLNRQFDFPCRSANKNGWRDPFAERNRRRSGKAIIICGRKWAASTVREKLLSSMMRTFNSSGIAANNSVGQRNVRTCHLGMISQPKWKWNRKKRKWKEVRQKFLNRFSLQQMITRSTMFLRRRSENKRGEKLNQISAQIPFISALLSVRNLHVTVPCYDFIWAFPWMLLLPASARMGIKFHLN